MTTLLTAGGMALVVFARHQADDERRHPRDAGRHRPGRTTCWYSRKGAGAEINSGVSRSQAAIIESLPGIATDGNGQRLVSKEPVVLNNLPKRSNGKPSNVTLRGTSPLALALWPQVRFDRRPDVPAGNPEITGRSIANGFIGYRTRRDAAFGANATDRASALIPGRTGFDSESWGDAE
ncbi:MAG: hypothetical protein IPK39_07795 [Sulfuritalea sp.]|nr:hypothetical protein [Sulfuritalea sp.]